MSDIDYKVWDVGTVTVADFGVQIELPKSMWKKWLEIQD
jgi:hypothetical protein